MKTRRQFLKLSAAAGLAGAMAIPARSATGVASVHVRPTAEGVRGYWCEVARRLADPVLTALAERRLKATMPVEAPDPAQRTTYTHLEALGRLLCGIAPWLELGGDASAEGKERARFGELARMGIEAATDPASPDYMNFARGGQPLVDTAFLAQAMLRAPNELWRKLDPQVQANVVAAMKSTRPMKAGESNWKLFATMVEIFLHRAGEKREDARLFEGLEKFRLWYLGDGIYGDGPEFHWDYYNGYVIQPMLLESLDVVGDESDAWKNFRAKVRDRFTRFAAIQERTIAPDGSFPVLGRSIAYRCGAFQGLALAALRGLLPKTVTPAQARVALTAVIRRTLDVPGTWDERGWLRIGLAGHQPALGEHYISTGSLYLCSFALLPLGLPATDPFWSAPAEKTTWEKAWSGANLPADKAISSPR